MIEFQPRNSPFPVHCWCCFSSVLARCHSRIGRTEGLTKIFLLHRLNSHSHESLFQNLFFSQSRHLKKSLKSNEGAPLTALGSEVSIMTDMVKV